MNQHGRWCPFSIFEAPSSHLVHARHRRHPHRPSWHPGVETRRLRLRPLPSWHHRSQEQMRRNSRLVSSAATSCPTVSIASFFEGFRRCRLSPRRTRSSVIVASIWRPRCAVLSHISECPPGLKVNHVHTPCSDCGPPGCAACLPVLALRRRQSEQGCQGLAGVKYVCVIATFNPCLNACT